ncbi:Uncharacterized WD repeat-containing protein alr2800 [Durusdinium trenchii]|uniref:Uncharacterized WD repeat-containing protein alr2800 n=1 Tax=Durusdinium trenchii TaxID=1381693 RepID=A0ABP0S2N0_9DINO
MASPAGGTFSLTAVDEAGGRRRVSQSGLGRRGSAAVQLHDALERELAEQRAQLAESDDESAVGAARARTRARDVRQRGAEGKDDEGEEGAAESELDIMMLLDIDKVPALRDEFEEKEEGLTLSEFVYVMMKYLKRSELDEADLVADLTELFARIDVNGDGTMEWDEFTSHIVETGQVDRENEPNSIQQYFASPWEDQVKHVGMIERASFFESSGRLATCEANSGCLQLYNPKTLELERSVKLKAGNPICATYLTGKSQFAVAATDLNISVFDDQNYRLVNRFGTDTSQSCLEWSREASVLYSAGVNGVVHCWDAGKGEETHCMGGILNNGSYYLVEHSHTDMVLDLLQIRSLESIVSASMDRTIKLWDVHTGKHKKTLEGHDKGVRSMAYSTEYRFLVSAGFDYDALVWNPYVEHLILRLSGHSAPLCKVEIIPDSPQIITADTTGTFKVWDIRNFGCVQTFTPEASETVRDFVSLTPHKTLLAVGRRMNLFEYETQKNPDLTDDQPPFRAQYNSTTMTIITASGRDVKIWDARKGTLVKTFRGLNDGHELSSFCLDDRERKLILGDHQGHIRIYDYANGSEMKALAYPKRAHRSEVSHLIYCNKHKMVISCAWDDSILIHDEMDPEEGIMLRKIQGGHQADITAMTYSQKLSLIATGAQSVEAPIILWDFEFCRTEAVLNPEINALMGHAEGTAPSANTASVRKRSSFAGPSFAARASGCKAITSLVFLDESFPGLVSADDSGGVIFWAIRPAAEWRNRSLIRFVNRNENASCAVTAMAVDQEAQKLYTADELGFIKVWDYSALVDKVVDALGSLKPFECENPNRRIHVNLNKSHQQGASEKRGHAARAHSPGESKSSPTGAYTVFRATSCVPLERTWQAHEDAISSLQIDKERGCIITAAHDCRVRVFGLDGKGLGTLQQGDACAGSDWRLDIDLRKRQNERHNQALSLLDEIQDLERECSLAMVADDDAKSSSGASSPSTSDASEVLSTSRFDGTSSRPASSALQLSGLPKTRSDESASPAAYHRRTPRLAPVGTKLAGRGFSSSLRGKRFRQRQFEKRQLRK